MNEEEKKIADRLLRMIGTVPCGADTARAVQTYKDFLMACGIRKQFPTRAVPKAEEVQATPPVPETQAELAADTFWYVLDIDEYGAITPFDGPHDSRIEAVMARNRIGETRRKLVLAEVEEPK